MSNVKFLRGTQTKLNSLTSFSEGAFYLTSDTDRLYFAQSDNELVYLNKYIININTMDDLPSLNTVNDGDFYYILKDNILCTKLTHDGVSEWVQINKVIDTNTDTSLDNVVFTSKVSEDKSKITITGTFTQGNRDIANGGALLPNDKQPKNIAASFDITSELIGQITVNTNVDVTVDNISNNSATIKTTGTGSSTDENAGFKISGTGGVTITGNSEEIVINSKEYSLQSAANSTDIQMPIDGAIGNNKVSLTSNATNGSVVINGASAGAIDISHKDYNYNNANELDDQDVVKATGIPVIEVLSGLDVENGHVIGVKKSEVQLNADKIDSVSVTENGALEIQMAYADGTKKGAPISTGDVLYYTIGDNNVAIGSNLDELYYTKAEIDNELRAVNALVLKGELKDGQDVPEASELVPVHAGDTYIVTAAHTVNGLNAKVGDLFIATGEENDEGYLNSITWIYVPSGDETVYTYTLTSNSTDGIVLARNDGPTNKIAISDDDVVVVDSTNNTLSFSHVKTNPTTDSSASNTVNNIDEDASFEVVTNVEANEYGHVEKITTTNFTLPNNNHSLSVANNTISLANKNGVNKGNVIIEGGDKLTASTANNTITISHDTLTPSITEANNNQIEIDLSLDHTKALFTTLQSIDHDGYGHIDEIKNSKVSFISINQFNHSKTQDADTGVITIENKVNKSNGVNVASNTTTLSSSSINLTLSNNAITAEIEWGEF